jgi:hypothetical protein
LCPLGPALIRRRPTNRGAGAETTKQMTISTARDNHFNGMHSASESVRVQSTSVIRSARVLFLVLTLTASMYIVPPALF